MQTRVKEMRERAGLTQRQLADALGVTQQSVYYYESGDRDIKASVLIDLSRVLHCTVAELLGIDFSIKAEPTPTKSLPVFGRIAAGTPREALMQSDITHEIPEELFFDNRDSFWLIVSGNSMNKVLLDGSLALINPNKPIRDGDVGLVFVNGDDATIKRVFFEGDSIRLHPESYDPEYRDRIIDETDPDAPEVRLIGRVVTYTAPDNWRA